jgi:Fe-S oxidoreductase
VASGASTLAVGCPFCMMMLTDAAKDLPGAPGVRDVAEILAEQLSERQAAMPRE